MQEFLDILEVNSCHRKETPLTGTKSLSREGNSSQWKEFPVKRNKFMLQEGDLVTGTKFLLEEGYSCLGKDIPVTGRNL